MTGTDKYEAVVIGTSAGGLYALSMILAKLPPTYSLPLIVVQHRHKTPGDLLEQVLQSKCQIEICQVEEKEKIMPARVYIAPPDYHLLIERDRSFSLTADEYVRFSRPSIDVLFESAAGIYGSRLAAIVLTGANADGSAGIEAIQRNGGTTIAQDPAEAEFPFMPEAAVKTGKVMHVLTLSAISDFLLKIHTRQ